MFCDPGIMIQDVDQSQKLTTSSLIQDLTFHISWLKYVNNF